MKGKKRVNFINVLLIAAGLLFAVMGLAFNLPEIIENGKRQKIFETGAEGVGLNLEYHSGGVEVNEVPYFYIAFDYFDENGVKHSGRTSSSYTETEAARTVSRGALAIIYNDKGAVEKTFDKASANKPHKILLLVFCGAGVLVAAFGVYGIFRYGKNPATVEANGVSTLGRVEETETDVDKNGQPRFRVKVSFLNQRGESVNGVTEWTEDYSLVAGVKAGDELPVKYYGKKVIIERVKNEK